MTVSDPGAGQQQEQECSCGHGTARHAGVQAPTQLWGCFDCTCPAYRPAPSPTPTARDSGRDEAREAVAPWRTGRKVGRTIYAQPGPEPADTDPLIGVMDTPELAQAAVDGHNAAVTA